MEPETPSRRTKAGDEPVTIDLEAVPASASNEALAADEKAEAEELTAEASEATASEPSDETVAEREEPIAPARSTYEEPAKEPLRAEAPPPRASAGTLAAGILGGLIALLGAGSLQYGGYLPALGPERAGDSNAVTALSGEIAALKTRLSKPLPQTRSISSRSRAALPPSKNRRAAAPPPPVRPRKPSASWRAMLAG